MSNDENVCLCLKPFDFNSQNRVAGNCVESENFIRSISKKRVSNQSHKIIVLVAW